MRLQPGEIQACRSLQRSTLKLHLKTVSRVNHDCPKIVRLLVVNVLVQILHVDVAGTTLSQTGVALTPHDASDPSQSSKCSKLSATAALSALENQNVRTSPDQLRKTSNGKIVP